MFGGAHAGARDLLSCCKRLDAPPQMTQDEALAGKCDGAMCFASIYPLHLTAQHRTAKHSTAPMICLKTPGSMGRGEREDEQRGCLSDSRKLLGLRHGSVLVRARSQIRLTDGLWRYEQEQLDLAYSCLLLARV